MINPTKKPSISDYLQILRNRGIKVAFMYFYDSHLFDIIHGTNTTLRLVRDDHKNIPPNFNHGTYYMASLSSEITKIFQFLHNKLADFENYTFIDIGCGKGKVNLTWLLELKKRQLNQFTLGIDYYYPLIKIARDNNRLLFKSEGFFACCDITSLDLKLVSDKLILYLYNPFDEVILENLMQCVSAIDCLIVYVNPVHEKIIRKYNFNTIYKSSGFYPSQNVIIFQKNIFTL